MGILSVSGSNPWMQPVFSLLLYPWIEITVVTITNEKTLNGFHNKFCRNNIGRFSSLIGCLRLLSGIFSKQSWGRNDLCFLHPPIVGLPNYLLYMRVVKFVQSCCHIRRIPCCKKFPDFIHLNIKIMHFFRKTEMYIGLNSKWYIFVRSAMQLKLNGQWSFIFENYFLLQVSELGQFCCFFFSSVYNIVKFNWNFSRCWMLSSSIFIVDKFFYMETCSRCSNADNFEFENTERLLSSTNNNYNLDRFFQDVVGRNWKKESWQLL